LLAGQTQVEARGSTPGPVWGKVARHVRADPASVTLAPSSRRQCSG
jgi:hypothetical protein